MGMGEAGSMRLGAALFKGVLTHSSHWLLIKGFSSESGGRVHPAAWAKNPSAAFWQPVSPFGTSGTEMQVLAVGRVARVC